MDTRRLLASVAALIATVAMYVVGPASVNVAAEPVTGRVLWMPVALLGASALLVHGRTLGAQLASRAVWWSNLVLGALICVAGNERERPPGAMLLLGAAAALLLAGRGRLDARSSTFAPLAFRGTLMAVLVMTLADLQSLVLFGALTTSERVTGRVGVALLAVAVPMAISAIGLFRLRVWGVAGNLVCNVALVGLALAARRQLPEALVIAYVLSAVAQAALLVPLLRAMTRAATR